MEKKPILSVSNISKGFGGLKAVDSVSFTVMKKQIKALVGPNGAGKTTVFNIITRLYSPDAGSIIFNGLDLLKFRPHQLVGLGIARTFQNIQLIDALTVGENIALGFHHKIRVNPLGVLFGVNKAIEKQVFEKVEHLARFLKIQDYLNKFPNQIPFGIRRLVEIARALIAEPKLMLLDEPAAGLNDAETETLLRTIFRIWERGVSILLIEHDMEFVSSCSHSMVVMDSGKKIAEGLPSEVMNDINVIKAYMGE